MRRILCALVSSLLTAGLLLAGQPAGAQAPADPGPSTYTSVSPVRVLDTRNGTGTGTTNPVGPGAAITLNLSSRVPANATAVVLNVTGVTPTANTFITAYPGGTARPTASNLNLVPGDIRPNQVTVTLGTNRTLSLYNHAGNTHLVADLAGYYSTGAGARFTALHSERVLDSRQTGGPIGQGETRTVDLSGVVPASATAVTFNLTATDATASTVVTAWPTGATRPTASNLNLPAGDTRANLVTVTVGTNRSVTLHNNAGSVNVIVDVTGFYTADYGAAFVPRSPTRILDTRDGTGVFAPGPLGAFQSIRLDLAGSAPLTATGVLLNVTAVDATASTYVDVWMDTQASVLGSTVNLSAGQTVPNAAMVAFGNTRGLKLYNNSGNVHLVADLAGVFVAPDTSCTNDCLYVWGSNYQRKLGTGLAVGGVPAPAPALSGVRAVATHDAGGYALRTDGTVLAWGDNISGQLGNGWSSWCCGSPVPVPVLGLTDITAIAGGYYNGYALRADGTVWAWGSNFHGETGSGPNRDDVTVPVQVPGLTDVVAIAGGHGTGYAVREDGTLWAWGNNFYGLVGNGGGGDVWEPVQVMTGVSAVAGSSGESTYALRQDGTVWAWGLGGAGQLGNGTNTSSRVPVQVSGLTGVTSIAAGYANGYAARNDGTAWAWGSNIDGRLGNGVDCPPATSCDSNVPVPVANLSDVTQVASFGYGGYALRTDGTLWAWGENYAGTLGNDSVPEYSVVPVRVNGLSGVSAVSGSSLSGYALVP